MKKRRKKKTHSRLLGTHPRFPVPRWLSVVFHLSRRSKETHHVSAYMTMVEKNHYRLSSLSSSSTQKIKCTQIDITISRTPPTYPHITFQLFFFFLLFFDEPHKFFLLTYHIFQTLSVTHHMMKPEKNSTEKTLYSKSWSEISISFIASTFFSPLLLYYSFSTPREWLEKTFFPSEELNY